MLKLEVQPQVWFQSSSVSHNYGSTHNWKCRKGSNLCMWKSFPNKSDCVDYWHPKDQMRAPSVFSSPATGNKQDVFQIVQLKTVGPLSIWVLEWLCGAVEQSPRWFRMDAQCKQEIKFVVSSWKDFVIICYGLSWRIKFLIILCTLNISLRISMYYLYYQNL